MHCGCIQVNIERRENAVEASQESQSAANWGRKHFSAGEISLMLLVPAHLGSVDFLGNQELKLSDVCEGKLRLMINRTESMASVEQGI